MESPLPTLEELLETTRVVSIPMRVKFRGVLHREVALFRGPAGWGEFGPFLEYVPLEASRWLAAGLEAAWQGFPEPLRDSIPVNATIPALKPADVPALLDSFGPVPAVKVKVAEPGQDPAEDIERVRAVRAALDATGQRATGIRVDANMGWDEDTAVSQLLRLSEIGLEYAEQPVSSIDGLARVRERLANALGEGVLKIAADESVRKAEDPLAVARAGAADLIIVKVAPLGGVRRAVEIVTEAGLPAVVSSALDTSVGIRAGLALAAALPELPYACGLGTVKLFEGDISTTPLVPDSGQIRLSEVVAEESLLEKYAADAERQEWWRARISSCFDVLNVNTEPDSGPRS